MAIVNREVQPAAETQSSGFPRGFLAAALLLDAAILLHLATGVLAAAVFLVFVAAFLLPATLLASRLPHIRSMPADLRLVAAAAVVVVLIVPWFFARRVLPFAPAIADVALCVVLTGAAARYGRLRETFEELRPAMQRSRLLTLLVLPILFAVTWLGYAARSGNEVLFHGLFAIDFGNLVSVIGMLRASPQLPLAAVTNSGPLNYHWLYFTLPAMLADFCGVGMPAFSALILVNLLMAALLIHALATVISRFHDGDWRATTLTVAVTLFAPFSLYYYQIAAARLPLGWLAMPTRNHLILSPLNSMIVFGNNTFALVLVLLMAMELERWKSERRIADVLLGTAALSMVTGYSVTLLFPLVAALLLWLVMGRIARPVIVLACAIVTGGAAVAMFFAIHVLGSGGARHVAFAFDNGQYLRIVILGMLPLWGLLLIAGRRPLSFFHVLIGTSIVVPSFLYVAGSPTGQIDFSMKSGSLIAIAFAPLVLIAIERWLRGTLRRWQVIAATLLIALGVIQTLAYVLQFPYYRLTGSRSRGIVLSRDYYDALVWLRDHTPQRSIVVDPGGLTMHDELPTLWIAQRRVWLPTPNTDAYAGSSIPRRLALWAAFERDPASAAAAGQIAGEADYLVVPREVRSPFWTPVDREGSWVIYRSTASPGSPDNG
jgi:hypothetical protein